MLTAAVFDDEYIVLQGLRRMIDWDRFGIQLVGTAGDGLSALELFRSLKPDIVITDIRMPGIDGLQLIEIIQREAPETACLVFSGFNEFEYVKRAIHLGVVDYLEKPVTIAKIEEGIAKVLDRIGKSRALAEIRQKWEAGSKELLVKATFDLMFSGDARTVAKWKDSFGSDAERVEGITVLASSEDAIALSEPGREHGLAPEKQPFAIVSALGGADKLHAVFHYEWPPAAFEAALGSWAETAQGTVGSGKPVRRLEEVFASCQEARSALRYGQYLEERGWMRFEDLGGPSVLPQGVSEHEEAVLFDMRTGNKNGVMAQLERFIAGISDGKLARETVENEMLKMVYLGLETAKETGGNVAGMKQEEFLPQQELRTLQTREEMAVWLRRTMEMIMDWMVGIRNKSKHIAVEKAVRYIDDHYGRDLSLQEVAEHAGMNATYFSLLFKEEMGITYIKYLTGLRIERSKELLCTGLSINEVSKQVGYYNVRHFSEVFKKTTGMTPGHYRTANEHVQGGSKR